ncbi:hypothetical protein G5714_008651 [Onychostoma macrolepis]|uniref:Uncharacterized protein n=1 Tax=Onychostoma macrolepis TaxID=369639 RepID=A0A7J6CWH6_9TELE|nr:hypothetical protein G5714_008651 [Onychostoma macrolepis]
MLRSSSPQPVFLTSEASVLLPPAPQVMQPTSSVQDYTPEVRHPNVVTWSSPPRATAQLTSDLRTVFTGPSPIYPATVTVQPTPPVTTVTYQQTPAVSVPPSVASPPDPATSGVSVLPQPRQVLSVLDR